MLPISCQHVHSCVQLCAVQQSVPACQPYEVCCLQQPGVGATSHFKSSRSSVQQQMFSASAFLGLTILEGNVVRLCAQCTTAS